MRRVARISMGALLLLTLGSCSYAYSLEAVVIDGRLAFVVAPWSERSASCINGIEVEIGDGGPTAKPAPGDDARLVNGDVYWWEFLAVDSCPNPFPIFYGQPLRGAPFIYEDGKPSTVAAKPLVIGHVYSVSTTGSGSGAGGGWFRITADGRVENWKRDPLPSVVNAQGYTMNAGERVPPPPNG